MNSLTYQSLQCVRNINPVALSAGFTFARAQGQDEIQRPRRLRKIFNTGNKRQLAVIEKSQTERLHMAFTGSRGLAPGGGCKGQRPLA